MRKIGDMDLRRARIPERYWNTRLSEVPDEMDYKEAIINYIKNMEDLVRKGVGLYLFSEENSTGKTSLACIIGKYAMKKRFTVLYMQAGNYQDIIINGDMLDEYTSIKDRAKAVDILILDDAVKEYKSDKGYVKVKIENLIRTRSQHLKPTIITTNTPPKSIKAVYTRDLSELMRECMLPVEVTGINWRARKEEELKKLLRGDI